MKKNVIKEKSFSYAMHAIDLYKVLTVNKEYIISKQFLKSATSIGANVTEASAAYSKKDFASKMSIASKEARESLYWLELLEYGDFIEYDYKNLTEMAVEIIKMLTAIVKTCQSKPN